MNKKLSKESLNVTQEKIEQLKKIFPEIVSENKVDFERLKLTLGENVQITGERYVLNWANKSDVFTAIQTPTTKTLQPLKEESINFDTTQNIFIEGDNLEVLKILQKSYFNKIKMIYIDPPYNTGNDSFIYPDKFAESKEDYLKKINEKDEEGYLLKEGLFRKNSKENGQFHSNWLSMMYPRLFLAKNLLKEDGIIFVSIDDNEVHNLRMIMNEIFGEENFVAEIAWEGMDTVKNDSKYFSENHEYILCFSKNKEKLLLKGIKRTDKQNEVYKNYDNDIKGPYLLTPLHAKSGNENNIYEYIFQNGKKYIPPQGTYHRFAKETLANLEKNNQIYFGTKKDSVPQKKTYLSEVSEYIKLTTFWDYKFAGSTRQSNNELANLIGKGMFDNSKPTKLLKILIDSVSNNDSIILDFFAGSGTTAQAVMELNKEDNEKRKFILVQLPEKTDEESEAYKAGYKTISEISKERIKKAIKKISSEDDMIKNSKDIDLGFKSYRLKESNFKIWRSDIASNEEYLKENIDMFEDSLKQNSKDENILIELLLKSGYDLNTKIEIIKIDSSYVYIISDKELIVCLNKISKQIIDKIIEIKPKKCFILDSLFEGKDSLKTNISLQLEDAKINLNVV